MNNKKSKKFLSLLIAVVFCVTTFAVSGAAADKAFAEGGTIDFPTKLSMIYYPNDSAPNYVLLENDMKVTIDMDTVQSTDPEVATLKIKSEDGQYGIYTTKAGKATVTFKAIAPGSATYVDWAIDVKVTKYANPCKSFKIGKKNYVKKFKKQYWFLAPKKISGKLVIKPAKGWKMTGIEKYTDKAGTWKKVKNKKKIKLVKNDSVLAHFKKKDIHEMVLIQIDN